MLFIICIFKLITHYVNPIRSLISDLIQRNITLEESLFYIYYYINSIYEILIWY